MKKMFWLVPAVSLVLMAVFVFADSGKQGDPEKGKAAFENYCVKCHNAERSLSREKDRDGWEWTVKTMSNYLKRKSGSPIPEDDQEDIVDYLLEVADKN